MQLVYYPDPFLRRKAEPLTHIDDEVRRKVDEMFEIMYAEGGVGLAAPQVGWGVRLFVLNVTGEPDPDEERVYVNPKVFPVDEDMESVAEEGCLSIPGACGKVTRNERVAVRALDLNGNELEEHAEDLHARVIQHEFDHLDGILFISRLSVTDRLLVGKTLKKLEKEYKEAKSAGS